jgi:hypothetical protein
MDKGSGCKKRPLERSKDVAVRRGEVRRTGWIREVFVRKTL